MTPMTQRRVPANVPAKMMAVHLMTILLGEDMIPTALHQTTTITARVVLCIFLEFLRVMGAKKSLIRIISAVPVTLIVVHKIYLK